MILPCASDNIVVERIVKLKLNILFCVPINGKTPSYNFYKQDDVTRIQLFGSFNGISLISISSKTYFEIEWKLCF